MKKRNMSNVVGENVRYIRKSKRLNQTEFGKKVGLSRGQVERIENARRGVTIDQIQKIALFFDVDIQIFFRDFSFEEGP